jgi:hypothetical protein
VLPTNFASIGTVVSGSSPGTVTFDDTSCTGGTGFHYRVRCSNGFGNSGYTAPVKVWTPALSYAGGREFHIGPGQLYQSIASFSPQNGGPGWDSLAPGDTIYIHCNASLAPYFERLMLTCRGTPAHPIRIVGISDPATGQQPILDGLNATTSPEFSIGYTGYETFSLIFVGRHATYGPGHAGWLQIENLELRGAYRGDSGGLTFTGYQGSVANWDFAGSGVYLQWCDNVTVKGCWSHGNGNGIFGKSYGEQLRYMLQDHRRWRPQGRRVCVLHGHRPRQHPPKGKQMSELTDGRSYIKTGMRTAWVA